ncbi:hypothetical protein ACX31A_15030 [Dermacoccus nishinomiyaensis]
MSGEVEELFAQAAEMYRRSALAQRRVRSRDLTRAARDALGRDDRVSEVETMILIDGEARSVSQR